MVKVKICGITNLEDALYASSCGADVLGFIFTVKSPRCLALPAAKKIIAALDPWVLKCGVFMDQPKEEVLGIARILKLDILQFHGGESAAYCKTFMPEFRVVKVLFPQDRPYAKMMARYKVDAYLFDIKPQDKDGKVRVLPEDIQAELAGLIKAGEKIIISSGLNINNIASIIKLGPYGVDVASGVEKFVGGKDPVKVASFIKKAKHCE